MWEDQASLNGLVNSAQHLTAARLGFPALVHARFAQFTVKWSDVPIPWETAVILPREHGRTLE